MARESIERFSRRRPDPDVLEGLLDEHPLRLRRVRRRARRTPSSAAALAELDEQARARR